DPRGLRGRGAADAQVRIDRLQRPRSVVIQRPVGRLSRAARPEVEVRLVPHLEVPLPHLGCTVALLEVRGERPNEAVPPTIILRWRDEGAVPEGLARGSRRELPGHEAELDEGPYAQGKQSVVDLIDIS